ncbi:hypothetical protein A2480_02520 [Candidatus Uhrbacteria bacterium RIFOXYC2_FULL_47_19]|uniref:Uncharacterized protein n=1 Tax=Candidatus Uhrbacteria bacterium RIFOXYC2_FULL_47_19 TaxID=1802424 RepID=A0A1F7WFE1_9BACT|nr:MAG: hypothetical protein A2480_02520 [Candidatus Uhrbacteria bacterium RIFOXYC2_FULL_47_19]
MAFLLVVGVTGGGGVATTAGDEISFTTGVITAFLVVAFFVANFLEVAFLVTDFFATAFFIIGFLPATLSLFFPLEDFSITFSLSETSPAASSRFDGLFGVEFFFCGIDRARCVSFELVCNYSPSYGLIKYL